MEVKEEEKSNMELESVASRVAEEALDEEEESSEGEDIENFIQPVGRICSCTFWCTGLLTYSINVQSWRGSFSQLIHSSPLPSFVVFHKDSTGGITPERRAFHPFVLYVNVGVQADLAHWVTQEATL